MNIVAIIQARMGSTRLPNKTLSILAGKPLIWHVFNRLTYSRKITRIVLATTENPVDDVLEAWSIANGYDCYRGSENDVLSRFYFAAKQYNADLVVRVTADDPFKDPFLIDQVIEMSFNQQLDFAYNNKPATFPEGLDTEVFTFKSLKTAHERSTDNFEREHITQYFYRRPDEFSQGNLSNDVDVSWLRWTIDTETDLEMVRKLYDGLYQDGKIFTYQDILSYLNQYPDIAKINLKVPRSAMYKK